MSINFGPTVTWDVCSRQAGTRQIQWVVIDYHLRAGKPGRFLTYALGKQGDDFEHHWGRLWKPGKAGIC